MEKHPGPGTDRTTAGPQGSAAGPGTPTGLRHSTTIPAIALVAALLPGQERLVPAEFVPAEFLLLGLADIYVSQTESRLLPTDELYQADVNTAGEVMEAFLQGPERQLQEL